MFKFKLSVTQHLAKIGGILIFCFAIQGNVWGQPIEELIVTGTRIKNADTYNASSAVTSITSDELSMRGADTLAEIVLDLTINTGSEIRASSFISPNITGTASMNLRGLGLGATLVLLNGRRMTLSAVSSLDGSQFVDINNVPLNVIGRLEILKDGASAIYGSDATAGVVNIITRDVEGLELDVRYQQTTSGGQDDKSVSLAWGFGNDSGKINLFYSYFDRNPLFARDREFTFGSFVTPLGFPGNFLPLGFTGPVGPPLVDPDCLNAGSDYPADNTINPFSGFCDTDETNSRYSGDLVPKEERNTVFIEGKYSFTDALEVIAEYSYSNRKAARATGSSLPLLIAGTTPFIPATHPDFPASFKVFPGVIGAIPILIKPVPNGQRDRAHEFEHVTHRLMGGFTYNITSDWTADFSVVYSRSNTVDNLNAIKAAELQLAILGFGGASCNPAVNAPGTGPCEFYNIFGSSIVDPSAPNYSPNSAAVLDFITGVRASDKTSQMLAVEAIFSGSLFELNGKPIGGVVGVQYRWDALTARFNQDYINGNLTFHPQSRNFEGNRDSYALFGELAVPLTEALDLSLALRYEDYGGDGGDTLDPKAGFGWQLHENILLRASYGTSFRAPTPLHLTGFDSSAQAARSTCGSAQEGAIAKFIQPNTNLIPEDSTSFSIGAAIAPFTGMDFSVDYWNYDYKKIIGIESVQGVINDACAKNPLNPSAADPRIVSNGPLVQQVTLQFLNLGTIETDGIDVSFRYVTDTSFGEWILSDTATYINSYDIAQGAGGTVIDGLGVRNNNNFGRPTPQWRNYTSLQWGKNDHSAALSIRLIDSYLDDTDGSKIDSNVTTDIQYSYMFANWAKGVKLTAGVTNLFDKDPPKATGINSYDPFVHDPRGRSVYVWLKTNF